MHTAHTRMHLYTCAQLHEHLCAHKGSFMLPGHLHMTQKPNRQFTQCLATFGRLHAHLPSCIFSCKAPGVPFWRFRADIDMHVPSRPSPDPPGETPKNPQKTAETCPQQQHMHIQQVCQIARMCKSTASMWQHWISPLGSRIWSKKSPSGVGERTSLWDTGAQGHR